MNNYLKYYIILKREINTMTKNNEYNRCFFETLKSLPGYYLDVTRATNNDDQRKALK